MEFLNMTCPNCGGSLEITKDMEVFLCGYCGKEQFVERKGGTVSLKLVDGLAKVQKGTDKTAAELALNRLKRDLDAVNYEWEEINKQLKERRKQSEQAHHVVGGIVVCVGFVVFCVCLLISYVHQGLWTYLSYLVVFLTLAAGFYVLVIAKANGMKVHDEARKKAWEPFREKIATIQEQINKNQAVVDS